MTNITKAAHDALEALDSLLDVAMVPMTCEGLCSADSAERWDDFSARRDALRAALQDNAGELHADGWLHDGGLLYRLTDGRRPENRDEISVTMADGSRSPESRARRAGELLDRIRSAHPAPVAPDDVDPLQGAANWIVEATDYDPTTHVAEIQQRLLIGYNRASRLYVAAMLAASQQKGGSAG